MIPAGGRLLIPEGSASCVCHYSLQTSIAFAPVPANGIPSLPNVFPELKPPPVKPLYSWLFHSESTHSQTVKPIVGDVSLESFEPLEFSSNGLVLNGTQWLANHLEYADLPAMPETVSLEARVQVDASPEWCGIVGAVQDNGNYERGCMLGIHDGKFFFSLASTENPSLTYLMAPTVLEKGKMSHVVGTYDGRAMRLYVDGVKVAQSDEQQGGLLVDKNSWLTVGAYKDNNELYRLKGAIKAATIYEGVLDAKAIEAAR